MKLSLIIPAYNEERLIAETLRHIRAAAAVLERGGWVVELIVCDNNSTDRTAELARAAGATVVFEPVNQIGRARDRGASAATGDWLLFVDADSQPSAALLSAVADRIATGRCLAGSSTVKLDGRYPLAHMAVAGWNFLSRTFVLLAGSFIFCEAEAFRRVGGFGEELYAGEEIALGKRLKRLARGTGRRVVILHAHPLLTSARKAHLYTLREHFTFLIRTILARGKTLNDPAACHTWYDGRR